MGVFPGLSPMGGKPPASQGPCPYPAPAHYLKVQMSLTVCSSCLSLLSDSVPQEGQAVLCPQCSLRNGPLVPESILGMKPQGRGQEVPRPQHHGLFLGSLISLCRNMWAVLQKDLTSKPLPRSRCCRGPFRGHNGLRVEAFPIHPQPVPLRRPPALSTVASAPQEWKASFQSSCVEVGQGKSELEFLIRLVLIGPLPPLSPRDNKHLTASFLGQCRWQVELGGFWRGLHMAPGSVTLQSTMGGGSCTPVAVAVFMLNKPTVFG